MSSNAVKRPSLPSDKWLDTFDFSPYLNDNLPDDQYSPVDTLFSINSIPLIPGGTWPGNVMSPIYLNHSLPPAQTINSKTDGISMMNHFTNSAYLEENQSGLPPRAKKACNQCRKKKTRCNRKGEEECVPSSKARKSVYRQSALRKIQGSMAISPSLGPQVIQLELPDIALERPPKPKTCM
ncbi:hypothetical protein DL95DRAFT_418544 [Leptodontidium sp. 2 PMI_412]|nr:hypothetical protein DL95DRAFT_418544 [Leptodontidium sp. 2 PMI_412]